MGNLASSVHIVVHQLEGQLCHAATPDTDYKACGEPATAIGFGAQKADGGYTGSVNYYFVCDKHIDPRDHKCTDCPHTDISEVEERG